MLIGQTIKPPSSYLAVDGVDETEEGLDDEENDRD